ncbi:uncharacterized protein [Dysidea avara]|uniref:uncharacterized protein isoform X2 n=1 Tax=Dysidea avara TaxID=196820 RepID=UPI00332CAFD0
MTSKLKSWSGNSSSLWFAMKVEKDLQKSATNFATTKSNAMSSLLQWSKGEQNQVFGQIFGKIAELNWMWEKTIEKFVEQFEAAKKKGDAACITTRDDELKTMISQYTSMQEKVAGIISKLEHTKVTSVKAALKEQANAYVNMARKCQAIFTAQRAVAEIIPVQTHKSALLSNQHVFFENISKLVDSLSKKLGLVLPHKERSDTANPVPARSRAATISHAPRGKIKLPAPPRSSQSLNISESLCEPIYITPNRKRSASMKPTINAAATQTIQKKVTEPYKSVEDWFPSQKYMPDSEDQENLHVSIGSYKRKDSSHYDKIEFERKQSKTHSLQIQTSNPQSDYVTILADTERADYTSGMTQSHPDSYLHYTNESDCTQVQEVSIGYNSLQLPAAASRYSHHASFPRSPEHKVDSLPPVDTSSPREPSSPNTLSPDYEELVSEELQTDTSSEDRVRDSNYKDYQFVRIKKHVDSSPVVSLCVTGNASLQHKPQLSRSCEDFSGGISNRLKLVHQSLSLDVPSSNDDSQLSMKSHSVDQVNTLAALNEEVYSFIANSLYPERKVKSLSQPSLSEIFKRYCQNEHTMPVGVPLKRDNKRKLLFGKDASLDSKMSSECSSLCSSVELLSDNSGTTFPTQPGMSEH